MIESVHKAIRAQYEAFTAPQPHEVEGCDCCTTKRQRCSLLEVSREKLSAKKLEFYAFKAVSTVGTSTDLRYFWPRLVELAVKKELVTDIEVIFGKPAYAGDTSWPEKEQRALIDLAMAIGGWLGAEEFEDASEVDAWVCAIGRLTEGLADPRPLLAPLLSQAPAARANLKAFVSWNAEAVKKKKRLGNAFWEKTPNNAGLVLKWFNEEPGVRDAERALALESSELYGTTPPSS